MISLKDLFGLKTPGASIKTARPEGFNLAGPEVSARIAGADKNKAKKLKASFDLVGPGFEIIPAILAGIASRESHFGTALQNGWGDGGNAYGIMQVDKRYHQPNLAEGPSGISHLTQAAGILKNYFLVIKSKHPDWPEILQWKGAIAAYNCGTKNIQTIERMDIGTTHDDYSADVVERAKYFAVEIWGYKHA